MVTQPDKSQGLSRYFAALAANEPAQPRDPNPFDINQGFKLSVVNYAMQNSSFLNAAAEAEAQQEEREEDSREQFRNWLDRMSESYKQAYREYESAFQNFMSEADRKMNEAGQGLQEISRRREELQLYKERSGENIQLRNGETVDRMPDGRYRNRATGKLLEGRQAEEAEDEYKKRNQEIEGQMSWLNKEETRIKNFMDWLQGRVGDATTTHQKAETGAVSQDDLNKLKHQFNGDLQKTGDFKIDIPQFPPLSWIPKGNQPQPQSANQGTESRQLPSSAGIQNAQEARLAVARADAIDLDEFADGEGEEFSQESAVSYANVIDKEGGIGTQSGKKEFNLAASAQPLAPEINPTITPEANPETRKINTIKYG